MIGNMNYSFILPSNNGLHCGNMAHLHVKTSILAIADRSQQ